MKRLRRFALLFAIAILTVAPAATVFGLATFTERTVKNPGEEQFKCYGCVFELTMVSADEGWATGSSRMLHYQGGALRWEAGPYESEIVASTPQDMWALNYEIWRYQGKSWTKITDLPRADASKTFQVVTQASLVSPTDIWAIGDDWVTSYDVNGVVWHFDGEQWQRTQTIIGFSLESVSMTSADGGWAVGTHYAGGEAQASAFLRYQNGLWSEVASPEGLLYSVAMTSLTDGWASGSTVSGEGALYHYNGTTWQATDSLADVRISRISMQSASAGWALGYDYSKSNEGSVLLRFADGVWTRVTIPADVSLYALSSLSPGDAWLVGAMRTKDQDGYVQGVLLHYLDGAWQTVNIPREPVTAQDAIPLRHGFAIMLGSYVLVLSALLILFARRRARLPISNEKVRRVFIVWAIVLLAVYLALVAASFFVADILEAVPWYVVVGVLALLISFPAAYLAWPLFYRRASAGAGVEV